MVIFVWLLGGDDACCSSSCRTWRTFEGGNGFLSGFDDKGLVSEAAAAVDTLETTDVTIDRSTVEF